MEANVEENWVKDLQDFISYWEKEVDDIKDKKLDSEECSEIAELFNKDKNLLLCRRPVGLPDEHIFLKLEPLANRLDASLAMALCSVSIKKGP